MLRLVLYVLCNFGITVGQLLDRPEFVPESSLIPRIINGRAASLGDVPYQVGFKKIKNRKKKLYYTFCGGSIISRSKLITAAHCFKSEKSSCCASLIVQEGKEVNHIFAVAATLNNQDVYKPPKKSDRNNTNNAQWVRVKKVIYPASFKFPKDDIAVVVTQKAFWFNNNVQRIPYTTRYVNYVGKCLVSGYGRVSRTFDQEKVKSEILLMAELELLTTYFCSKAHKRNMKKFICTSSVVSDTSKGDSGGPLVCKNTGEKTESELGILVGVLSGKRLSRSLQAAKTGTMFTRVSSFASFISKNGAAHKDLMTFYHYLFTLVPFCYVAFG